ncbi:hypothetical protein CORT_0H00340 [Candida orthopsilosis Co 90-125]|uniref:Uncharacterized protein n=1 Tax=Candida orthopsilosis (strain 90-125) TaxID=1136231 RepID=H8XBG4_CANO9|nr:hypothetical protein CORT_0H00340 [Candida orthopsilosis Co 90-125]CCG25152.1 hypothetical protein CORT_0H00340 [Candida orthopsilosis Co 90-125]
MSMYESYDSNVTFSATGRSLDTGSTTSLPGFESNEEQLVILFSKVINIIDNCPYCDTHELLLAHRSLCDNLTILTDVITTHSEAKKSFSAFMANNRLDYIINNVIFDSFLKGGVVYTTYRTFRPTHQLIAILFSICESCRVTFQRELFLESIEKMIKLRAKYLAANRLEPKSIIGNLIEDVLGKLAPDPDIAQLLKERLCECSLSSEAMFLMSDIAAFTTNLNTETNTNLEDFNQLKKTFEEILMIMLTRNYSELDRDTYKAIRDCYNSYFHHINLNTGVYEPNSLQQNSDLYHYEVSNGNEPNVRTKRDQQPSYPATWIPSFLEDEYYNENTNTVNHVVLEKPTRNPFKMLFRRRILTDKRQRWHLFHRKQQNV